MQDRKTTLGIIATLMLCMSATAQQREPAKAGQEAAKPGQGNQFAPRNRIVCSRVGAPFPYYRVLESLARGGGILDRLRVNLPTPDKA